MRPRPLSALALALSALVFSVALATPTLAQQPPSAAAPLSTWTMPGNLPAIAVAPAAEPYPAVPGSKTATLEASPSSPSTDTFVRDPTSPPRSETAAPRRARPRDWAVDLGAGTEIPISVGGLVTLELPHRLLLQLGAGLLPGAYAETIDGFLTKAGAYDSTVSSIIRGSLRNSLVARASGGIRPFENHGFEIMAGYTLMTMGGEVTTSDILNAILLESGSSLQAPAGLGPAIPISSTLHNLHASLGWRWLLAEDHLVLRASVSYIQTVDAHVAVKIPESAGDLVQYEAVANQQINAFLSPYFAKYAKAPTLGLSAAFRF